jgi:hypothetical protein
MCMRGLAMGLVLWVTLLGQQSAAAQSQSVSSEQRGMQQSSEIGSDYNGEDVTRPESRLQIRFQGRMSGLSTKTHRMAMYVRLERARTLHSGWKFSWYAELPVISKSIKSDDTTNSDHQFGIGDIAFQGALSQPIDERWAYGFGLRVTAPSAMDMVGNGKWQIAPAFGIRYLFLEFGSNTYFVPKIRYAVSVAGDPSKRHISEPQIAPTLNVGLPDRWFLTVYPSYDIRINVGDPISGQTGKLFLPFDAAIGRKLSDTTQMSLEIGVPIIDDYPVYKLKAELRLAAKF